MDKMKKFLEIKNLVVEDVERYLLEVFYDRIENTSVKGKTTISVVHKTDRVDRSEFFSAVIKTPDKMIMTGKGGLKEYFDSGGRYDTLSYNGVSYDWDKTDFNTICDLMGIEAKGANQSVLLRIIDCSIDSTTYAPFSIIVLTLDRNFSERIDAQSGDFVSVNGKALELVKIAGKQIVCKMLTTFDTIGFITKKENFIGEYVHKIKSSHS